MTFSAKPQAIMKMEKDYEILLVIWMGWFHSNPFISTNNTSSIHFSHTVRIKMISSIFHNKRVPIGKLRTETRRVLLLSHKAREYFPHKK